MKFYFYFYQSNTFCGFPGGSEDKVSACNAGNPGLIPGLGRSSGEENGNPLQYSCLENPMDRGTWWATAHGVAKSRARLSDFTHSLTHTIHSVVLKDKVLLKNYYAKTKQNTLSTPASQLYPPCSFWRL